MTKLTFFPPPRTKYPTHIYRLHIAYPDGASLLPERVWSQAAQVQGKFTATYPSSPCSRNAIDPVTVLATILLKFCNFGSLAFVTTAQGRWVRNHQTPDYCQAHGPGPGWASPALGARGWAMSLSWIGYDCWEWEADCRIIHQTKYWWCKLERQQYIER